MPKHLVLHPVLHDRKIYDRGTTVILSARDGETLHKLGNVGPAIEIESSAELVATTAALDAMTKAQIVALAADKLDLTLSPSLSKPELIERIVLAGEAATEELKNAKAKE